MTRGVVAVAAAVVVVVVKVTVGVVIVVAVAEAVAAAPELSAVAEPRLGDTDQRARQAGQASQAVKSIKRSRDGSVPFYSDEFRHRSFVQGSAPEVRCAQDCGKAFELVSPSLRASTSAKAPPAKLYIASEGGLPLMTK
ncbi:hypothetical protein HZH66_007439 [Vespula vulgaris]|uniref:Uncharacterized protein n=1 Tax=Vespula vulgaris TaxID=7454 RepID=A0A834JY50_VESVU|nr:hypothetical protein HZH66_007439 [Vespula vulgaris]